ncbi:TlpA disulfide reductase family protein [uncultured Pseudomonas sp.]|uniref:TlpA family protein disulfide reductase n=1 Tax=uncultured Pseudomonas sp. TaxID=114707 RepID=UPI0025EFA153|nr:TlpA disulfide reductase family protein [uncultured Pseudomonas sp.]MCW1938822.1 TlpA family protein disulfide reductase [Pseudomonas sp. MDMC_285]
MTLTTRIKWLISLALLAIASQGVHAQDSIDEGERRAQHAGASLIGKPAPAAVLETIDGERIDLSQLYGKKPVYLKFWATWCVPCRQQMPGFEEVQQTLGDDIQIIAVNTGFSDDIESVRAYREELGLSMPIVVDDGSLAAALNLRVTPQHVLIGRDGRIAHIGHLDDPQLHAALNRIKAVGDTTVAAPAPDTADKARRFGIGDQVEGVQLTTLDGTAVSLGQASGKPRALVFFAPWCEPYLAESRPQTSQACQRVRQDVDKLAAQSGVDWLGISSGLWTSKEDLQDYKTSTDTRLPLALDEDDGLFRAFGVRDIPSVVLLDAQGRVAQVLAPQDTQLAEALNAIAPR